MIAQTTVDNGKQTIVHFQTIKFAAIYLNILAENGTYLKIYINDQPYFIQKKKFDNDFIALKLFPTSNDKIDVETDGKAYVTVHGMVE